MKQTQIFPLVTLILPIRNEADSIEACLTAILAQDYPVDRMQLLIADGMSSKNIRNIVNDFAMLHAQLNIHILDNPSKIVPIGMNIALRQAK